MATILNLLQLARVDGAHEAMASTNLGQKILDADGRPSGFDYMRLLLASAVILHHSFLIGGSPEHLDRVWHSPDRAVAGLVLPMFFALSGFLVAGSLERNNSLLSFLGLRVIRLMPALALEVCLSALVLGTCLTTINISSYLTSKVFFSYFLNVVGDIHYLLPGVFENNPLTPRVNAQLWTVPVELKSYIVLATLALLGITSRRRLLMWSAIVIQLAMIPMAALHLLHSNGFFHGRILIPCFIAGVIFFKYRERVPRRFSLAIASLLLTMALLLIPLGDFFLALPVTYLTTYIGTLNPARSRILFSGDYSYGIYLYGFPIQQALTTLGTWTYPWWVDFFIAYPVAVAFAIFSWWAVEKRALRLKRYVMTCEGWLLRVPAISWHSRRVFNPEKWSSPGRSLMDRANA